MPGGGLLRGKKKLLPLIIIISAAALLSISFAKVDVVPPRVTSEDRPGKRSKRKPDDPFWERFYDMSIVYTWVNGSDPEYLKSRSAYGRKGVDSRSRDSGELLHSLRSLEKFVPWHNGTVYLVVPGGTPPYWLNTSHPRIRIIDQDSILSPPSRPTFNSAVIEMHLCLIPNLTEIFIHMNDDYFIGREVHPSDFITDQGGVRLFHEANKIKGRKQQHELYKEGKVLPWRASVFKTSMLLDEQFGPLAEGRYYLKHAPFVYSKTVLLQIRQTWAQHFNETCRFKFRSFDDILIPFAHHGFVQQTDTVPFENHVGTQFQDSVLCLLNDNMVTAHELMTQQLLAPHMFFTVNDEFAETPPSILLRSFLHAAYPKSSQFERTNIPENTDIVQWTSDYEAMARRCEVKLRLPPTETLDFDDPLEYLSCGMAKNCSGKGCCTKSGCICPVGSAGKYCEDNNVDNEKTWKVTPACEGFDVVFTWVNGSDPALILQMKKHTKTKEDKNPSRVQDTNQLRYGLRSIERYMPWVRHIWVVSGTPCPWWLNSSHPKISYIPHSEIFSSEELPQLNSNSIQGRLWAIPNLAYRWVSMDDDFIVTRASPPQSFLGDDLTSTAQLWIKRFRPGSHIRGVYLDSLIRTRQLVENALHFDQISWWSQAHSPPICDRFIFSELRRDFASDFKQLAGSKMRSSSDLEPNFAHAYYLQGWTASGKGDLQSISSESSENLICRIAGKHPSKWKEHHKQLTSSISPGCVSAAINNTADPDCRKQLIHSATLTVTKFSHTSKGYFKMLKNGIDFKSLKRKIDEGNMRVACLNDDFVDGKPSFYDRKQPTKAQAIRKLESMMKSLQPSSAPWERDR